MWFLMKEFWLAFGVIFAGLCLFGVIQPRLRMLACRAVRRDILTDRGKSRDGGQA